MSDNSLQNRIPAEAVEHAKAWVIPPITEHGKILSSTEKEAREIRERLLRREKETIETVDIPEPEAPPQLGMTAEEMQAIFDTAEKDGYEQGHKEGFAKGNAEGYESGRQQGLMEMRAQLVAEQQRFHKLTNALLDPVNAQDNDVEHLLLDVICTLTQSVVQRELLTDSSHILSLVKSAVHVLPIGSKNIRVCLNPHDLAAVESYAAEQQLAWSFFGDAELLPGGCRIETPESRVDFSVSARLQTVLEQFISKQLASGDNHSDEDDNALANTAVNPHTAFEHELEHAKQPDLYPQPHEE